MAPTAPCRVGMPPCGAEAAGCGAGATGATAWGFGTGASAFSIRFDVPDTALLYMPLRLYGETGLATGTIPSAKPMGGSADCVDAACVFIVGMGVVANSL